LFVVCSDLGRRQGNSSLATARARSNDPWIKEQSILYAAPPGPHRNIT